VIIVLVFVMPDETEIARRRAAEIRGFTFSEERKNKIKYCDLKMQKSN